MSERPARGTATAPLMEIEPAVVIVLLKVESPDPLWMKLPLIEPPPENWNAPPLFTTKGPAVVVVTAPVIVIAFPVS